MPYQPSRLRIRDLPNGDFVIEDEEHAGYEVAELFRSVGAESDLPLAMRRGFAEELVALWNGLEDETPVQYAVAVEHSPLPVHLQPALTVLVEAWGQALGNVGGRKVTEKTLTQMIEDVHGLWTKADIEGITLNLVCDLSNNTQAGMEQGEVRGSALLCTKPEAAVINLLGMPVTTLQEGLSWATAVTKEVITNRAEGNDEEMNYCP
jgi:hypothetical protein